jgi:hypothetical protein
MRQAEADQDMLEMQAREWEADHPEVSWEEVEASEAGIRAPIVSDQDRATPRERRPKALTLHQKSRLASKAKVAEFKVPAAIEATAWARAIVNELSAVAPADQLAFARTILSEDCEWQYAGQMVRPIGPTLAVLRRKLAMTATV